MQIFAHLNGTKSVHIILFSLQSLFWWQPKQNHEFDMREHCLSSLVSPSLRACLIRGRLSETYQPLGICSASRLETLRTLFPSATCGCIRVAPGKGRVVSGDLSHAIHTHNPCFCALEPRRDARNGHVLACNVYFTAEFLESWHEVTGLSNFYCCFAIRILRFSSAACVSHTSQDLFCLQWFIEVA